jgi:hypothetical protein
MTTRPDERVISRRKLYVVRDNKAQQVDAATHFQARRSNLVQRARHTTTHVAADSSDVPPAARWYPKQ